MDVDAVTYPYGWTIEWGYSKQVQVGKGEKNGLPLLFYGEKQL